MHNIFKGIFDTDITGVISVDSFMLCISVSMILGLFIAGIYSVKNVYTKSFMMTLAMLPTVVCVVIMMVNGNVGTGVAVAGAFSLVRFRSAPGNARDISTIFLAMGTGLLTGMGYIGYAVLFTVVLGVFMLVLTLLNFGANSGCGLKRVLRITIPEELNYVGIFDDLFETYLKSCNQIGVKTTNMGTMFKLSYEIEMKNMEEEKKLIDEIRCRNGNLEISINRQEANPNEL